MNLEDLGLVELNSQEVTIVEGGNLITTLLKEAAKTAAVDAILDLAKAAAIAGGKAWLDFHAAHPDINYRPDAGKI